MSDTHVFADKEDAAERYLLGQMSETDQDAYEEHFFQCVECADEVKATARFIDGCKAVLTGGSAANEFAQRKERRPLLPRSVMVLTGALAATLALVVYQNVVTIPTLTRATAPQALESVSLAASNARGTASRAIVVHRGRPYLIYVDIPPGQFDAYDVTFVANDGRSVKIPPVSSLLARDAVPVMVTEGLLPPGNYTVVVSGRPRVAGEPSVEVARIPFTLQFAD